jgi:hypothetical protein
MSSIADRTAPYRLNHGVSAVDVECGVRGVLQHAVFTIAYGIGDGLVGGQLDIVQPAVRGVPSPIKSSSRSAPTGIRWADATAEAPDWTGVTDKMVTKDGKRGNPSVQADRPGRIMIAPT